MADAPFFPKKEVSTLSSKTPPASLIEMNRFPSCSPFSTFLPFRSVPVGRGPFSEVLRKFFPLLEEGAPFFFNRLCPYFPLAEIFFPGG